MRWRSPAQALKASFGELFQIKRPPGNPHSGTPAQGGGIPFLTFEDGPHSVRPNSTTEFMPRLSPARSEGGFGRGWAAESISSAA